ncbi:MAG: biopolymer transporter ExbD [Treponema sp.]|jgi:biopolymer transport protein ExbD|nr:biopolymer transporter ExbD [Treponema sp.]
MKSFARKKTEAVGVDITPLLDVVFQLLLFFILTSALVQLGIELDLPESNQSNEVLEADMVISIDKEGRVFFNDRIVGIEEVEAALRSFAAQNSSGNVILRVDSAAAYGNFFSILDASRNAGIKNIHLAYEEK